jgi:hypothetical protein
MLATDRVTPVAGSMTSIVSDVAAYSDPRWVTASAWRAG